MYAEKIIITYSLMYVSMSVNYLTCSGETGIKSERQVSNYVGINSAGYFDRRQSAYPEASELPFNN